MCPPQNDKVWRVDEDGAQLSRPSVVNPTHFELHTKADFGSSLWNARNNIADGLIGSRNRAFSAGGVTYFADLSSSGYLRVRRMGQQPSFTDVCDGPIATTATASGCPMVAYARNGAVRIAMLYNDTWLTYAGPDVVGVTGVAVCGLPDGATCLLTSSPEHYSWLLNPTRDTWSSMGDPQLTEPSVPVHAWLSLRDDEYVVKVLALSLRSNTEDYKWVTFESAVMPRATDTGESLSGSVELDGIEWSHEWGGDPDTKTMTVGTRDGDLDVLWREGDLTGFGYMASGGLDEDSLVCWLPDLECNGTEFASGRWTKNSNVSLASDRIAICSGGAMTWSTGIVAPVKLSLLLNWAASAAGSGNIQDLTITAGGTSVRLSHYRLTYAPLNYLYVYVPASASTPVINSFGVGYMVYPNPNNYVQVDLTFGEPVDGSVPMEVDLSTTFGTATAHASIGSAGSASTPLLQPLSISATNGTFNLIAIGTEGDAGYNWEHSFTLPSDGYEKDYDESVGDEQYLVEVDGTDLNVSSWNVGDE